MADLKGHCQCGAVEFEIPGADYLESCHCTICRRLTAGPFIGIGCHNGINITKDDALIWYDSSDWARRGFCGTCGANLMYNLKGSDFYSVSAGAVVLPANIQLTKEYFIDEKPSYYEFSGDRIRLTGAEVFASFESESESELRPNDD